MALTCIENVAAIVDVEKGTRTAQVALSADGVRAVVFAFDTGAELTQHTAPCPILVQTLDGHVQLTAEGETRDVIPGTLLHLDARVPHSVLALEPSKMLLTLLRKD